MEGEPRISAPAKESPSDERSPTIIYSWWQRDIKVMAAVLAASTVLAPVLFILILPSRALSFFIPIIIPTWIGTVAALAIGLYLTKDWWNNWSIHVALDGERARSAIERALTESGVTWRETTLIEAPRYFRRRFSGPIEILMPPARIWMRSESFRPSRSEPLRHFTVAILQPLGKTDELGPLRTRMLEAFKEEGRSGSLGNVDASAPSGEG